MTIKTNKRWALYSKTTGSLIRKTFATREAARINKTSNHRIYDTYTGNFVR